jgi:hypothetical protein
MCYQTLTRGFHPTHPSLIPDHVEVCHYPAGEDQRSNAHTSSKCWQAEEKSRALSGHAIYSDLPAMGLNNAPGNGQAQASAACGPATRLFPAVESFEDMWQVFGADPFTRIRDFHNYPLR